MLVDPKYRPSWSYNLQTEGICMFTGGHYKYIKRRRGSLKKREKIGGITYRSSL